MKNVRLLISCGLFVFGFITNTNAQTNIIETIAGTSGFGGNGFAGDGGPASAAGVKLNAPYLTAMDAAGNLYIADNANFCVREINASTGIISTVAGTGTSGGFSGDLGLATAAKLGSTAGGNPGVVGIAVDPGANFLYIDDATNNRIRIVSLATGIINTICGSGTAGFAGDGGPATAATCQVSQPRGIAVDGSGNIYFVDNGNQRIRMINASTGIISTIAGTGTAGYSADGVAATTSKINNARGITVDASGNVYFADMSNDRIRMITASTGIISTVAGGAGTAGYAGDGGLAASTATKLNVPTDVKFDAAGNMYIADVSNNRVRMVNTSGIISTIAGSGTSGFGGDGSLATAAAVKMSSPVSVAVAPSGQYYYIVDRNNNVIRQVRPNSVPYFTGGTHQTLTICENSGAASINGMLAIYDTDKNQTETWSAGAWTPVNGTAVISGTAASTGGAISPSTFTYTPTVGASGSDSFIVKISDGISSSTDTFYVTINPLPVVPTLTGASNTVCVSSTITFTDGTAGGAWNSTTGDASVISGTVTGITAGADVISYTVTNACGPTIVTANVTVNPLPDAGIIGGSTTTVCLGSPVTLTETVGTGTWGTSNGNATVAGGVVTGVNPGTADDITYTVANSCGTDVSTYTMTILTIPGAGTALSGPSPSTVCQGSSIVLTSSVGGGAWSESSGNTSVVSGTVSGIAAGTDVVTYALTNSCGTNNLTQSVTVNPLPDPGVIGGVSTSVCVAGTITLTETVAGTGSWSAVNGHATITGGGVVTGVSIGSDVISYTVLNSCGSAAATTTVNVVTVPSAGTVTGTTYTVCQVATITLTDATFGGTWSASNGNATVSPLGVVTGVSAGTDVISYTVIFSCGTAFATKTVTVNPLPAPAAISGASSVCVGSTTILHDATVGGSWTVTSGDALVAAGTVSGITVGSDLISYSVTNGCGTTSVTQPMTINPILTPSVLFTASPGFATCPGDPVTYSADPTNGGVSPTYQWKVNGVALATGAAFVYTPANGDIVQVLMASSASCVSAPSVSSADTVVVHPSLAPSVNIAAGLGGDTVCIGDLSNFSATASSAGTTPTFGWNVNGLPVAAGSTYSYNPVDGDIVTCTVISSYVCPSPASVTSAAITMTVNTTETPIISISVAPGNPICSGLPVTFTVHSLYAGITPFYRWTKNGINVATGPEYIYTPTSGDAVYAMMASSATCRTLDSVFSGTTTVTTITSEVISVSIAASSGTSVGVGKNDTLRAAVTGATGLPNYQWYVNGTAVPGATSSFYIVSSASAGTELINCVASAPCATAAISNVLSMNFTDDAVSQLTNAAGTMKVSPNPGNGQFVLTFQNAADEKVQLIVTNTMGQKVKEMSTTTGTATDISLDQPAGIYFLSAITEHGRYQVKVVVE